MYFVIKYGVHLFHQLTSFSDQFIRAIPVTKKKSFEFSCHKVGPDDATYVFGTMGSVPMEQGVANASTNVK